MLTLNINGKDCEVNVPEDMPLLWVLRDILGMTGTKFGCEQTKRHCTGKVGTLRDQERE